MTGLNENHKRRLLATFRHVDELLAEVLDVLGTSGQDSPFTRHVCDATPVQQKVVGDYIARMRATTRAALDTRKIDVPGPQLSAVWASRTALRYAEIAVEELGPEYMRGYGEISEEAARDLNSLVSQLLELLEQTESYLTRGSSRDLSTRLRRFEGITEGVGLLSELERVITAHGLVGLRGELEALLERLESNNFEVGVFGRVSSGKSLLLNYFLKTDVLPAGATPVTAVPVRVTYGAQAWGKVSFVNAAPQIIDLGRLPEFATEHFNPSNMRHVTRINVELPAPLLKDGVVFVDTPGIGSLATGAAESFAYVPRCDLGIVLIEAGGGLTQEDVALVDAILHSGAGVMVLLSKADLLTALERVRAETYVSRELEARIGAEVPAYLVSVKGEDTTLCERWLAKALLPRLRDHRRLATVALRHKLGVLHDAVKAALEKRLTSTHDPTDGSNYAEEANRILSQALATLDQARRQRPEETARLHGLTEEILDETAHNAAVIWNQHHESRTDATALLVASLDSRVGRAVSATVRNLTKLRAVLQNALAAAGSASGMPQSDDADLLQPRGAPVFDSAAVIPQAILRKPALAFLGTFVLRRSARKQLAQGALKSVIGKALAQCEKRLEHWRMQVLDDLRQSFAANGELIRARFDDGTGIPVRRTEGYLKSVRDDLHKLLQVSDPGNAEMLENVCT